MLRPKTRIIKTPFLGVNKVVDPLQLNEQYFVDSQNVKYTLKGITKREGYVPFCDMPDNEWFIRFAEYYAGPVYYLLAFTRTKLMKYDSSPNTFQQVGTNTYSSTNYICYATGFNSIFFTNNIDRVKYWKFEMEEFDDLPGLNDAEPGSINVSRVYTLATFENFLILANTTENAERYPTRVRWSRYGDYTLWKNNPDGTGMAGYLDLQNEPTPIISLIPFYNFLLVFKTNCAYALKFVGTPYIFVVEKILETGLFAPFAYGFYLNNLVFVGEDNIYFFNGSSLTPIGDLIKDYFFNTVNFNRKEMIRLFVDEKQHLVFLFYPTANAYDDYNDRCLVYNIELKAWFVYDIEMTDILTGKKSTDWTWDTTAQSMDTVARSWDEAQTGEGTYILFSAPTKNKVYSIQGAQDIDFDYPYRCSTKHFVFENLIQIKRLYEIVVIGQGVENLQVKVNYGDNFLFLPNSQTFDIPEDGKIQCDISAKVFQFEFILKNKTQNFVLNSFYCRFLERGLR